MRSNFEHAVQARQQNLAQKQKRKTSVNKRQHKRQCTWPLEDSKTPFCTRREDSIYPKLGHNHAPTHAWVATSSKQSTIDNKTWPKSKNAKQASTCVKKNGNLHGHLQVSKPPFSTRREHEHLPQTRIRARSNSRVGNDDRGVLRSELLSVTTNYYRKGQAKPVCRSRRTTTAACGTVSCPWIAKLLNVLYFWCEVMKFLRQSFQLHPQSRMLILARLRKYRRQRLQLSDQSHLLFYFFEHCGFVGSTPEYAAQQ